VFHSIERNRMGTKRYPSAKEIADGLDVANGCNVSQCQSMPQKLPSSNLPPQLRREGTDIHFPFVQGALVTIMVS